MANDRIKDGSIQNPSQDIIEGIGMSELDRKTLNKMRNDIETCW